MSLLYPKIIASRGLVLVSPVHHYNVTALIKAFIDRLYCFYTFENTRPREWSSRLANQNRRAVLVAICEQVHKQDIGFTLDAMRRPLTALGYEIVGELPVFGVFDRGKVKTNTAVLEKAASLGSELAHSLSK
jgi:multimeric flavodoxin WrbA